MFGRKKTEEDFSQQSNPLATPLPPMQEYNPQLQQTQKPIQKPEEDEMLAEPFTIVTSYKVKSKKFYIETMDDHYKYMQKYGIDVIESLDIRKRNV